MAVYGIWKKLVLSVGVSAAFSSAAWANQVHVALEGSLITVVGDNFGNDITIVQNALGDITVTGRNGTLINGRPSARFPRVALNAMEIRMEGGNDLVTVRGLNVANDLYVNLGAGADRFTIPSATTVGAVATIEGAEGADTIRLTDLTVGEDLFVDGGLDVLSATITGLVANKAVTIIGDEANDTISISNSGIADVLSVETKGGNDRVTVSMAMAFGASIATDMGIDTVQITDLMTSEDIGIFTGVGNDSVRLTNVISNKSLIVSVDEGADSVVATAVSAAVDAIFEGGAGVDSLTDFGITAGIILSVKEFEILLP